VERAKGERWLNFGRHHSDDKIYGSTTVGERGQIVVPAEARRDLGLSVGEKVIVMSHGHGLLLLPADIVAKAVSESMNRLADIERRISDRTDEQPEQE